MTGNQRMLSGAIMVWISLSLYLLVTFSNQKTTEKQDKCSALGGVYLKRDNVCISGKEIKLEQPPPAAPKE